MDKAIIRERIYNYRQSYHHWIIGVFKEDGHVWFSCDDFECYTGVKRWRHKLHNNIEHDINTTKDLEPENCKLKTMLNAVKEANQDLQKEIKQLRRNLKWVNMQNTKGNTSKRTKND